MKQTMRICIFCGILYIAILSILVYDKDSLGKAYSNTQKDITFEMEEPDSELTIQSSHEISPALYCIHVCDGELMVYCQGGQEVYLNTGIHMDECPQHIQKQALEGHLTFANEEELFSFLESYSS